MTHRGSLVYGDLCGSATLKRCCLQQEHGNKAAEAFALSLGPWHCQRLPLQLASKSQSYLHIEGVGALVAR